MTTAGMRAANMWVIKDIKLKKVRISRNRSPKTNLLCMKSSLKSFRKSWRAMEKVKRILARMMGRNH